MDWDKLRVFHAVASAGSLTHAGETLHLSQSAVSRQIRGLEESLGATLFRRHPRGLLLTEQGELLFKATSEMSERLDQAGARIRDAHDEVWGDLKVTTTVGLGTTWLIPRFGRLFERYPDLSLDLNMTEAVLDLTMRKADVAVRLNEPTQSEVIRRPLMEVRMRLYASKGYIERNGKPETADDLDGHRLCTYSEEAPQPVPVMDWLTASTRSHYRSLMTVNSYYGVLQAAEAGLGVAAVPDYVIRPNTKLIRVAPDVVSPPFTVFLAYPEELRSSRRVQAFRDFVVEEAKTIHAAE